MMTRAMASWGVWIAAIGLIALDTYIASAGRRYPWDAGYFSLPTKERQELLARGKATPRGKGLRWVRATLLVLGLGSMVGLLIGR